jgi:LemA protein
MMQQNPDIPEDMADEVIAEASRLYAQTQDSYSLEDLKELGQGVQLPPVLIEKALAEVKAKRQQEKQKQQEQKQQRTILSMGLAGVAGIVLLWGIYTYNSLLGAFQEVEGKWAQVENQLQRRADLIPNLVSVVKARSQQEQVIIEQLNQSRQMYLDANNSQEQVAAIAQIDRAIAEFNQYILGNSELQSSEAFRTLQYEIAGTENRIATERRRYNQSVEAFNRQVQAFPNSIIAGITSIETQPFFKANNLENPDVEELIN